MDFKNKTIEILSSQEFSERLKKMSDKGIPIGGIDLSRSRPFDDYVFKLLGSTNRYLRDFFESGGTLTEKDIAEISDARSESVIGGLLSSQSFDGKNDDANKEVLHIPEDYSFDDVPAKETFSTILDQARVDIESDKFEKLPTVIEVGNKTFGTLGNFSMVIGKAKSGKTFLTTLFASAALNGKDESKFISVSLPENKRKVVVFDTEQSESHTAQIGKRIKHLIKNYEPGYFDIFSLRRFSIEQRLEALEELFKRYSDIGLVIIDGIKDLVDEVNNEKQSSGIGGKLLEWTQIYNLHIIVVLHQNKGNNDPRGHLGTELLNKAETIVSVSKKGSDSKVKSVSTRNEDFPSFTLSLKPISIEGSETVIPYVNTNVKLTSNDQSSGRLVIKPDTTPTETHKVILKDLNKLCIEKKVLNKGDAKKAIKKIAEDNHLKFGDSKAQEFCLFYEEKGWIEMINPTDSGRPIVSVKIDSIK